MGQEMNDGDVTEPEEHEKVVEKVREHGRFVCQLILSSLF